MGLKSGARYEARGAYRFSDDLQGLPLALHLVSAFELLRHGPSDAPAPCLLLVVPFQGIIESDGKVKVGMEQPRLFPCPDG